MAVLVSAGDKTLLEDDTGHKVELYGSVLVPIVLWSARINDAAIARGETDIIFDTGSGLDFTLIGDGQEVWLGTTTGGKEIAKLRVRSITSGDAGVTGTVTVAKHPWIPGDTQFLTFKLDYPIKPKFPFIDGSGDFFKDGDVAYTDENNEPPPVVVMGPHRAGFIGLFGTIAFVVDAGNSYTMESGSTITNYAIAVEPTAGSIPTINASTGLGSVTFNTAGQRWVKITITDSNGKTQSSFRSFWAHEEDPNDPDYPHTKFQNFRASGDWKRGGWSAYLRMTDDATETEIPEDTLMVVWERASYGATQKSITLLDDGETTVMAGYMTKNRVNRSLSTGGGYVDFDFVTAEAILRKWNYSVAIEAIDGTPDKWWKYNKTLTVKRAVHHLWKFHSTIFECTDVIGLNPDDDPRPVSEYEQGDLYSMADGFASRRGIRAKLISDKAGRIHMTKDINLLNDAARGALDEVMDVNREDHRGNILITEQQQNRTAFVKVSGFAWDGTSFKTTDGIERADVNPLCASAPGIVPDDEGTKVFHLDRQTLASQTDCNEIAGRLFGQENNRYPQIPIVFHGNYAGVLDVAYPLWYTMSLAQGDTDRGLVWTSQKMICRNVSIQHKATEGTVTIQTIFEAEASAIPGVAGFCLDTVPTAGGVPPIIPPEGLPDPGDFTFHAIATAGSAYFGFEVAQSWASRLSDSLNDIVKDPYWVTKSTPPVTANDAILLTVADGLVKRSTNALQTAPTVITPGTAPPNDAGDSPAPTAGDLDYIAIDANRGVSDAFAVLATWQNATSDWRSWIAYTQDNGTSWTWTSLGAYSASNPPTLDSFGSDHDAIVGPANNIAGFSQPGANKAIVRLNDTKSVVLWMDNTADEKLTANILTVSGSTITAGADHVIEEVATIDTPKAAYALALSETKVLFYWLYFATSFDWWCKMVIGTVTGTSISLGAYATVDLVERSSMSELSIAKLSSTKCVLMYDDSRSIIPGHFEHYIRVLNISGTNVIPNAAHLVTGNTDKFGLFKVAAVDSQRCVMIYDKTSNEGPFAMPFDIQATTPNFGIERALYTTSGQDAAWIDVYAVDGNGRFVFFWMADAASGGDIFKIRTGDVSGVIGSPNMVLSGQTGTVVGHLTRTLTNVHTGQIDGTHYITAYNQSGGSGNERFVISTIAPGGFSSTISEADSGYTGGSETDVEALSLTQGIHFREAAPDMDAFVINYTLPLSLEVRGLGMATNNVPGTSLWVTAGVNGNMKVLEHLLPGLALTTQVDLGAATFSEIANFQRVAYPYLALNQDIYIIGRMNDPQGLGDPAHVIRSINNGSSWILVEDGWGGAYGSAVIRDHHGILNVVQSGGGAPKFYRGLEGGTLIFYSVLPFTGRVRPNSLWFNGAVFYIASDAADSTIIVKGVFPFLTWTDITYNHGISDGINGFVLI